MKFDGEADGKRVIIRDCGTPEVDACGEEPEQYANTRAKGTLCTCMSDKCNDSNKQFISSITAIGTVIFLLILY